MNDAIDVRSFSPEDFSALSRLVVKTWRSGVDRDWSVPAGTLEWSCRKTADHTVDCVFSYALFLASRRQDSYPPFGELHALPNATPADLVDGLQASATMWPRGPAPLPPTGEPWLDLLERSGRARLH